RPLEGARAIATTRDGKYVLAVAGDRVWRMPDDVSAAAAEKNADWAPLGAPTLVRLRGLHFADGKHGWVVGDGGALLRTNDAGEHWTSSATAEPVALNAVFFLDDGKRGWVVGNDGYIATTDDGGATLVSRTRPRWLA